MPPATVQFLMGKRTWKRFMTSHWDTPCACDCFSVEALGITGTVRYVVFFVIELKSRAVEIAGTAVDPGEEWMKQGARNLTDASSFRTARGKNPRIGIGGQDGIATLAPLHERCGFSAE